MRITNNMMFDSSIRNLNNNLQRLSDAQTKYSTQSKIQVPSDDPVIATRAIKYRDYVADVEQYQKNTSDATSWMQVTDDALQGVADYMTRLKELITNGANDTNSTSSKAAIADEIKEIRKGIIDTMNTSYAGRYVFGGYDTDKPPYSIEAVDDNNGHTVDMVKFKEEYLSVYGPVSSVVDLSALYGKTSGNAYVNGGAESISYHVSQGSEVKVNVEGQDVIGWSGGTGFANNTNLFDTIAKALIGLSGESSYQTADAAGTVQPPTTFASSSVLVSSCLDELEKDLDRLTKTQSELGARMNYVDSTDSRLASNEITFTKLQSNNEDIDVAKASVEVSSAQSVYEAALSVTAKVTKASLVDYLR